MQGDIDRKPPLVIRIIGFVILFSLGYFAANSFFDAGKNVKDSIRVQLDSINKTAPIVYDNFMRFDSVSLVEDDEVKYNLTFIDVDSTASKLYIDALKYKLKNQCESYYEKDAGMKPFRDNKIIVDYFYYDKNGNHLFDITIKPNKNR